MSTNRKDAAVQKTALKLAQQLEKSCEALNAYTHACIDAGRPFKGNDDGRVLLRENMSEFHHYLRSVYDKEGGVA